MENSSSKSTVDYLLSVSSDGVISGYGYGRVSVIF